LQFWLFFICVVIRIALEYLTLRLSVLILGFSLATHNLLTVLKLNLSSLNFSLPRKAGIMSYQAIKEYLCAIVARYRDADKKAKKAILNEAEAVTQLLRMHRIK
jgi:hypothetical protein